MHGYCPEVRAGLAPRTDSQLCRWLLLVDEKVFLLTMHYRLLTYNHLSRFEIESMMLVTKQIGVDWLASRFHICNLSLTLHRAHHAASIRHGWKRYRNTTLGQRYFIQEIAKICGSRRLCRHRTSWYEKLLEIMLQHKSMVYFARDACFLFQTTQCQHAGTYTQHRFPTNLCPKSTIPASETEDMWDVWAHKVAIIIKL